MTQKENEAKWKRRVALRTASAAVGRTDRRPLAGLPRRVQSSKSHRTVLSLREGSGSGRGERRPVPVPGPGQAPAPRSVPRYGLRPQALAGGPV